VLSKPRDSRSHSNLCSMSDVGAQDGDNALNREELVQGLASGIDMAVEEEAQVCISVNMRCVYVAMIINHQD